jgi:hypothetical protein
MNEKIVKNLQRCPNGFRRNKKTGKCEKLNKTDEKLNKTDEKLNKTDEKLNKNNFVHAKKPEQKILQQEQTKFARKSTTINWIKSRKRENGLEIIELEPELFLYRGNRKYKQLENISTYFTIWYGTTNHYIGTNKGYINIYELKNQNLKLLNVSDINSINLLLQKSFDNKAIYKIIKRFFISVMIEESYKFNGPKFRFNKYFSQFETKNQPWQVSVPMRSSFIDNDFKFSKYLCNLGYNGYVSDDMFSSKDSNFKQKTFPAEIMLCEPKKNLKEVKSIFTKRFKKITEMKKEIGQSFLNKIKK